MILLPGAADATSGTFVLASDFHFNPFDPPDLAPALSASDAQDWPAKFEALTGLVVSPSGKDTNYALLASAVAAIAATGKDADFAIVPGDFLSHGFNETAGKLLGVAPNDPSVAAMAVKTTIFVAERLKAAMPDKPVFLTLGNEDSICGDYQITPAGPYLAATRDVVRRMVGPGLLSPDFDETYAAGGYYSARHPTVAKAEILVLNDVLWSAKYQNACGTNGDDAGKAMFAWLEYKLSAARAAGEHVWLAHHIPWGIDSYATAHDKATSCPAEIVPMMKDPFAAGFIDLLRDYSDVVTASFSGHTHFDDYRLVTTEDGGAVIGVDKIAPAISPIYGQNPGFHVFTYDRASGMPTDFSTTYLTNLDDKPLAAAGKWQQEYVFSDVYKAPYSVAAVDAMWGAVSKAGAPQITFRTLYDVSRGEMKLSELAAHICAIGNVTEGDFDACFCGQ